MNRDALNTPELPFAPSEFGRPRSPATARYDHDVISVLTGIVCEVLNVAADLVTVDSTLTDLPHVESIKLLRIAGKVERRFGIELENEALFRRGTLGDLAEEISNVRARAA